MDVNDALQTEHQMLLESHKKVRAEYELKLKKLKDYMVCIFLSYLYLN